MAIMLSNISVRSRIDFHLMHSYSRRIVDLAEEGFTIPLCHMFAGQVVTFSKQKFSSNVIEKVNFLRL